MVVHDDCCHFGCLLSALGTPVMWLLRVLSPPVDAHDEATDAQSSSPNEAQVVVDALLQEDFVRSWNREDYKKVRSIQRAPSNQGRVDLMQSLRCGGRMVAVKKMPNEWVTRNHEEFCRRHHGSLEQPWVDVCVTKYLHGAGYPYVCEPLGVFRSSSWTFVVSAFADVGDLFMCLSSARIFPAPGREREVLIFPLVHQLHAALRILHEAGISHGDFSPENIVLSEGGDGMMRAHLIDFGMAKFQRWSSGARGKDVFAAPETHESGLYDCHLVDAFAFGVVLFGLATNDYPWFNTRSGQCDMFDDIRNNGWYGFLSRRPVLAEPDRTLDQAMSTQLVELIAGFLDFDPSRRLPITAVEAEAGARVAWLRQRPLDVTISRFALPPVAA